MLTHDHVAHSVGDRDLNDSLDCLRIAVSAVSGNHKRWVLGPLTERNGVENRLHEILEVVLLLENSDFLPKAAGACFLVLVRFGRDRLHKLY